ncbi:MAG TPA: sugar-binding protein, partial [Firmicutes bacterium]|nr:sugar-binding protein [Bacillota bacterium]
KEDEIFKYENKLYKVIQEHTSQEDWIPSELPALYLNMMPENVIPEWVQPAMAEDAYSIGDKVIFEGEVYESIIGGNTWSPTDYPQGWKLI